MGILTFIGAVVVTLWVMGTVLPIAIVIIASSLEGKN